MGTTSSRMIFFGACSLRREPRRESTAVRVRERQGWYTTLPQDDRSKTRSGPPPHPQTGLVVGQKCSPPCLGTVIPPPFGNQCPPPRASLSKRGFRDTLPSGQPESLQSTRLRRFSSHCKSICKGLMALFPRKRRR